MANRVQYSFLSLNHGINFDFAKARLDALVASAFCTADELDMKIKDRMRMLSEVDAIDAIDEMNGCSRSEIRNFGSYFMGISEYWMRLLLLRSFRHNSNLTCVFFVVQKYQ